MMNHKPARPETETTKASSITLLYNEALLRGNEKNLIEVSWDDSARLSLEYIKKLQEGHRDKLIIGTHPGGFHADELLAISMISILLDSDVEIVRSRDLKALKDCDLVIDTGEGLLDHHGSRNDKISCAASRVYRLFYQTDECRKAADPLFWERLAALIDAVALQDNGIEVCERFSYVNAMARYEVVMGEPMFDKAFQMVRTDLMSLLYVWDAETSARTAALQIIHDNPDDTVLVFDRDCRAANVKQLIWEQHHPALYYISPESETDWRILCCCPPKEKDNEEFNQFASRYLLPKTWLGKRGKELEEVSGIEGAIFCHMAGFIAGWKTKEQALEAADKAVRILLGEEEA